MPLTEKKTGSPASVSGIDLLVNGVPLSSSLLQGDILAPTKRNGRKNSSGNVVPKQLDFYSIMPDFLPKTRGKKHNPSQNHSFFSDPRILDEDLAKRIFVKTALDYVTTDLAVVSYLAHDALVRNYDFKIPVNTAIKYFEGAQLPLDYILLQRQRWRVA